MKKIILSLILTILISVNAFALKLGEKHVFLNAGTEGTLGVLLNFADIFELTVYGGRNFLSSTTNAKVYCYATNECFEIPGLLQVPLQGKIHFENTYFIGAGYVDKSGWGVGFKIGDVKVSKITDAVLNETIPLGSSSNVEGKGKVYGPDLFYFADNGFNFKIGFMIGNIDKIKEVDSGITLNVPYVPMFFSLGVGFAF